MPKAKNVKQLDELKDKVGKAKSIFFTNYAGLNLGSQTKLRAEMKAAGGEMVVAKNTLINIVLNQPELKSDLEGQTAVIFSYEDEVGALKKLVEFVKANEKPELKRGFMDGKVLTKEEVLALSKLPGKPELISMLLNRLQGPATGLVGVMTAGMRNLVYAIEAIRKQKEGGATA